MKNNDYHNLLLQSLPDSYKEWFSKEKEYLRQHVKPNASVLEVGSGDGRSIFDLIPITQNITGVDIDDAVTKAKEVFVEVPSIKIIHADGSALPFENETFEYVVCMASFVNFGDKKIPALKEMKRVLKNDGKMILTVFSENALPERMKVYEKLNVPIKEIRNGAVVFDESLGANTSEQFTKSEIEALFDNAGLRIEDLTEVQIAYLCTLSKGS